SYTLLHSNRYGKTLRSPWAAEKVSYTKFWRRKPLISTSGGRFPWATSQLPRKQTPLPAGSSLVAFPTGVAALRSNQLNLLISIVFQLPRPCSHWSLRVFLPLVCVLNNNHIPYNVKVMIIYNAYQNIPTVWVDVGR